MNICLYTGRSLPGLGGAELVIDRLARLFTEAGHEVTVLAPRPGWFSFPEDQRVPYRILRHPPFLSKRYGVEWYGRFLMRAHRRFAFDLIHSHEFFPHTFLAACAQPALGVPLVATSHGGDVLETHSRYRHRSTRERAIMGMRSIDAMIAVSPSVKEDYLAMCGVDKRVESIPNGVDVEQFRNQASRPVDLAPDICAGKYFLFLGRLTKRKGVDVLLDSVASLPPRGGVELVIAGYGREEQVLRSQVHRLGLQERVRFVGSRVGAEKAYLLQNALFTVVPTRKWEACSLVALESFAAGRPVVGTRVRGITHLVEGQGTGVLVEPNDVKELAEAICKLRDDEQLRCRLGAQAARYVEAFDWAGIAQRHLNLYEELISRNTIRPSSCAPSSV